MPLDGVTATTVLSHLTVVVFEDSLCTPACTLDRIGLAVARRPKPHPAGRGMHVSFSRVVE